MSELLEKITSYNLFNYLLPGILFAVIGGRITGYALMEEDLVVNLFIFYFYGLVISRVGSLVVEPLLIKLKFIKYAEHAEYVSAEKKDSKLPVLLEQNNVYRTLSFLFILLLAVKIVYALLSGIHFFSEYPLEISAVILAILFLASYRKQTGYIKSRVDRANEPRRDGD